MTAPPHPVAQEEVMAYLDGELAGVRAAAVARHLAECGDCRVLSEQLRGVSAQMAAWTVEPCPASCDDRLESAARQAVRLRAAQPSPVARRWFQPLIASPARAAVLVGAIGLVVLVAALGPHGAMPKLRPATDAAVGRPTAAAPATPRPEFGGLARSRAGAAASVDRLGTVEPSPYATARTAAGQRMVARTVSLTILVPDLDRARADIDRMLERYRGYAAGMTISGDRESGRNLNAALRVPAIDLDGAVHGIKALGRVLEEHQTAEDVFEQATDLDVRLSNARRTETRLIEILNRRTDRVADVLAVEREIARVRTEIERMDAERKNLASRVEMATIQLSVSEQQKASLDFGALSAGAKLHNALTEGYRAAIEAALDLVLFVLREGPRLLLWAAVLLALAWPLRALWRRRFAR